MHITSTYVHVPYAHVPHEHVPMHMHLQARPMHMHLCTILYPMHMSLCTCNLCSLNKIVVEEPRVPYAHAPYACVSSTCQVCCGTTGQVCCNNLAARCESCRCGPACGEYRPLAGTAYHGMAHCYVLNQRRGNQLKGNFSSLVDRRPSLVRHELTQHITLRPSHSNHYTHITSHVITLNSSHSLHHRSLRELCPQLLHHHHPSLLRPARGVSDLGR